MSEAVTAQGEAEPQTNPWFLKGDAVLTSAVFEAPQGAFCDCLIGSGSHFGFSLSLAELKNKEEKGEAILN